MVERFTIQRRISNSVDFDRGWDDYVNGFGEVGGNYWMGLEKIHQLTTTRDVSLNIDVETYEGDPFTLTFETFLVGNAASNYAWNFTGYSQTSERLKRQVFTDNYKGMMFTTRDRDNDVRDRDNCATDIFTGGGGGWWYYNCGHFSPNGHFEGDVPSVTKSGIVVYFIDADSGSYRDTKPVKSIEMIISTSDN